MKRTSDSRLRAAYFYQRQCRVKEYVMKSMHHSNHRAILAAAAFVVGTALLPLNASAQAAWPNRPIKLIVPFAAGGGSDVTARAIANKLAARLGQPLVIENKGGAGGSMGAAAVAGAPADGYTLLFTTTAIATNAAIGNKLSFDTQKDFEPIGQIGATALLVIGSNDSKVKTLRELIETARAKPNGVTYGSGGISSMSHLGMELLAAEGKVQMLHVPYKGMAPALNDLIAGSVQVGMSTVASAKPFINSGRVRVLGVTSAQRSPFLPNAPTVAEAGLPGFQIEFWWGLLAPVGTPPAVIKRLNEELNWALLQPDIRETLAHDAAIPKPGTPEEFRKLISFELARWSKLVKDANIKPE